MSLLAVRLIFAYTAFVCKGRETTGRDPCTEAFLRALFSRSQADSRFSPRAIRIGFLAPAQT